MSKTKNNKVILFLIFTLLYFSLGITFSIYFKTSDFYNVFFGADTRRVVEDLTIRVANHYRATVHPLFVILFQPVILLISGIIKNKLIGCILLQSILNAGSVCLMYSILTKLNLNKKMSLILTLIFGLSFGNIIFSMTIETYPFAQFFLILLLYYTFINKNKILNKKDYCILSIIGLFCLGITITNYFIYGLVIIFLTFFNKNMKGKKIKAFLICITTPIILSIILSELQALIFPNTPLYLIENIKGMLQRSSEELTYIAPFSLKSIVNQIKNVFGNGLIAPNISYGPDTNNMILQFGKLSLINKSIILFSLVSITIMTIMFIKKNRSDYKRHQYLYLLIICFGFNFCLHLLYGNTEGILYVLHYQFLLILIISYIISNIFKDNNKYLKYVLIIFLVLEIIMNAKGIYSIFKICENLYEISNSIPVITLFISIFIALISILLLNTKKISKIIIIILISSSMTILYIFLNKVLIKENYIDERYVDTINLYKNQISNLQDEFNVKIAFNQNEKFFFFGMGNRQKLLYKNGKLINLETNEIIKNYNTEKEMIIPNEYTVLIKSKDEHEIKIYENANGIYIEEDGKVTTLDEGHKLNLPEFNGSKYSEILKVLHQEILFNIKDSVLKPNILVYDNGWYRDAMMAAMVLDKTDNISIIKDWIDNINNIYDEQNGEKEADNLGELLYLINITKSDNVIISKIEQEVKRLQKESQTAYISGLVDGEVRSYYPSAILEYAIIESQSKIKIEKPNFFDSYSTLAWFNKTEGLDNKSLEKYINDISFPYLSWASYHSIKKGYLYLCDNLYPLSYEQKAAKAKYNNLPIELSNYKSINLSPTHIWDASEKFLFLNEQS